MPRALAVAGRRADQTYTSAATAILVDVVVRDRKGRPVTDLDAADFELFEDGVAQKVDTFSRVSRGGGIGLGVAWQLAGEHDLGDDVDDPVVRRTRPPRPGPAKRRSRSCSIASLRESLRLAQRATLDYVPVSGDSEVRVGVFATEPGLQVLQRYTTDRVVVRSAVARVLPGTSSDQDKARTRRRIANPASDARNPERHVRRRRPVRPAARRWRAAPRKSAHVRRNCAWCRPSSTCCARSRTSIAITAVTTSPARSRRGRNTGDAARAQDDRLLLRGPAGLAGPFGTTRRRHRRRQSRQRDDVCDRRARAAHADRERRT